MKRSYKENTSWYKRKRSNKWNVDIETHTKKIPQISMCKKCE
jgi:hypothetical protein